MGIFIVLFFVFFVFLIGIFLHRNMLTYAYQGKLNSFCYERGMQFINAGHGTPDYYDWYGELPDYDEMVLKFWKPLDSFVIGKYRDDFLEWNKNG